MCRADRRMRVQRLDLVGFVELRDRPLRRLERLLALGQELDEARPPLEELSQLADAQLPR